MVDNVRRDHLLSAHWDRYELTAHESRCYDLSTARHVTSPGGGASRDKPAVL